MKTTRILLWDSSTFTRLAEIFPTGSIKFYFDQDNKISPFSASHNEDVHLLDTLVGSLREHKAVEQRLFK